VAAVETIGLSKSFGDTRALADLDLVIEPGTVFGFLGPNGAGKTTMIRLLLDLIRPTAGKARVLGFDAQQESLEVRRRCGYLPGELKLPAKRSAGQLLSHLAGLRGDVSWHSVVDIADRLGLDLNRRSDELSKGNRQKVGLVAAFMAEPSLVILDEPTSGLDPLRQQDVRDLIRETVSTGRTVLLSSHDLDQVEHVADRVAIIREGTLVAHEDVSKLRGRATREVTVLFEGEPPSLDGLPGVEIVERGEGSVRMRVTGEMDRLVKALAEARIVSLSSSKPELDEIFLSFYEGGHER
jgi:ABC-2 type transport system ATP-binding protein